MANRLSLTDRLTVKQEPRPDVNSIKQRLYRQRHRQVDSPRTVTKMTYLRWERRAACIRRQKNQVEQQGHCNKPKRIPTNDNPDDVGQDSKTTAKLISRTESNGKLYTEDHLLLFPPFCRLPFKRFRP